MFKKALAALALAATASGMAIVIPKHYHEAQYSQVEVEDDSTG